MGTVDEFLSRAGFTAEELATRAPDHVADTPEDDDPRNLRGEDVNPDVDGWE